MYNTTIITMIVMNIFILESQAKLTTFKELRTDILLISVTIENLG